MKKKVISEVHDDNNNYLRKKSKISYFIGESQKERHGSDESSLKLELQKKKKKIVTTQLTQPTILTIHYCIIYWSIVSSFSFNIKNFFIEFLRNNWKSRVLEKAWNKKKKKNLQEKKKK